MLVSDQFNKNTNELPGKGATILCAGLGWFPSTPGGMERYGYELIQHLVEAGDQIHLCGVGLPEKSNQPGITLLNFANHDDPLLQRLWSTKRLFRAQLQQIARLDAINLHFSLYSLPLLQDLPPEIPVTFTFHGPWSLESQQEGASFLSVAFKQWLEQRVYQRCDRFIVLSKAFGTILHQRYQIPWCKIHVIPGGVDTTRFQITESRQSAREALGWQSDRYILFTPRRLVQRMGLDVLLDALAVVKIKHPNVWLAIAGKGPQRDSLEQRVVELGLTEHVQFLGYVPDEQLPLAYQAADLTVMPSQSLEGFGLVLLESLSCGTPVLCTPVGGMPEVLSGFSPELVTVSKDSWAMTQLLNDILAEQVLLPSRSACREHACTYFDWAAIAPKVRHILLSQDS
jgi:glycosyltransferase involved in cell wall biosynthesis